MSRSSLESTTFQHISVKRLNILNLMITSLNMQMGRRSGLTKDGAERVVGGLLEKGAVGDCCLWIMSRLCLEYTAFWYNIAQSSTTMY